MTNSKDIDGYVELLLIINLLFESLKRSRSIQVVPRRYF